jgi:hypothetical protein
MNTKTELKFYRSGARCALLILIAAAGFLIYQCYDVLSEPYFMSGGNVSLISFIDERDPNLGIEVDQVPFVAFFVGALVMSVVFWEALKQMISGD